MEPVYFEGCLGWLHAGHSRRGAVLCGPLGREADFIYRSWRSLAEMLSAAGLHTLRFEYRGFGDSAEEDDSPDRIASWTRDAKSAAEWLKANQRVQEVVFVGFRYGAAAAAAAAAQLGGVHGLALLAPVTSGRSYRRELSMMAKIGGKPSPADDEDLCAAGITCTPQTLADLDRFEPFRPGEKLAPRLLTLLPPGAKPDRVLSGWIAASNADARQAEFSGHTELLVDADFAACPEATFGRIVDWAKEDLDISAEAPSADANTTIGLPEVGEHTVFLKGSSRLFGVVTRPDAPSPGAPAIVFLNTGATRHTGTGRIAVLMARRFAELGLTSLRFDIAGVGDSPDREGQRNPIEHLADGFPDVHAALDWTEAQGFSSAVLIGFCRGAQLACNMAFRDRRARTQILIAPPPYFWNDEPAHRAPISNRRYMNLMTTAHSWRRLMRGEISPPQMVRIAFRMIGRIVGKQHAKIVAANVARRLRTLRDGGTETLLVYGDSDEFLIDNEEYFSTPRENLPQRLGMTTAILPGIDHLFLERSQREILFDAVIRYFNEHLGLLGPKVVVRELAKTPAPIAP